MSVFPYYLNNTGSLGSLAAVALGQWVMSVCVTCGRQPGSGLWVSSSKGILDEQWVGVEPLVLAGFSCVCITG